MVARISCALAEVGVWFIGMAKKKKTQLKPVARGFATTSVPKKVVPVEEEPVLVPIADASKAEETNGSHIESDGKNVTVPPSNDEFDLDKVEEQSLQNLVDKLQDKVEKEVVRTVKVFIFRSAMSLRFHLTFSRLSKWTGGFPKHFPA